MSDLFEKFARSVFFDWYQGTFISEKAIYLSAEKFISRVLECFPMSSVLTSRPRINQYQRAVDIKRGDMQIVHICWDGLSDIHFISTGSISHEFSEFMHKNYMGQYGVSRADVRADMVDSAAWEYMHGIAYRFAERSRSSKGMKEVKTSCVGDWDTGENGRTYYLGSSTSAVQVRIYEKGKKEGGNKDWVRYEAQIRPPKSKDKAMAAVWRAVDFWSSKPWLMQLSSEIFFNQSLPSAPSFQSVWSSSGDVERTTRAMCKQYGKHLAVLADSLGGWDKVGGFIDEYLKALELNEFAKTGFGESPYPVLPSAIGS